MNNILKYLKRKGGFARMSELRAASFQTRDIARLVQEGQIEKVKSGLYKLPEINISTDINASLVEVSHAVPKGIIALASAIAHYGLSTFVPSEIYVAIPLSDKPPKIAFPPIRFFYYPERFYRAGIEEIGTSAGIVRMYNKEKTICDMFRYRNKIGENLALEALKNYLRRKDSNIKKLNEFAAVCRVKTIILPYIKAMVS
ncbi:MAG: type IV toxin-antitoxin system AbiEi family antitoxin domain-containing protein [bacterium]